MLLLVGLVFVNGVEVVNLVDIEVKFFGYIKVDVMYSDYLNGEGVGFGCDIYVLFLV